MKCFVCGSDFILNATDKYIVNVPASAVSKALLGTNDKIFEAFDCPCCGCQNLVNERFGAEELPAIEDDLSIEEHMYGDCNCCEKDGSNCSCGGHIEDHNGFDDDSETIPPVDSKSITIGYGPENRKANDVTPDYLHQMNVNDLLAFCGEVAIPVNDITKVKSGKRQLDKIKTDIIVRINNYMFSTKEDE